MYCPFETLILEMPFVTFTVSFLSVEHPKISSPPYKSPSHPLKQSWTFVIFDSSRSTFSIEHIQ